MTTASLSTSLDSMPINCAKCNLIIDDDKQDSIACHICEKWFHVKKVCSMKKDIFSVLKDDKDFLWVCKMCVLSSKNQDIPYEILRQEVIEVRQVHAKLKSEVELAREQLSLKEITIIKLKSELQMKTLTEEDNIPKTSNIGPSPNLKSVTTFPNLPTSNRFDVLSSGSEDSGNGGECDGEECQDHSNDSVQQTKVSKVKRKNIFFEADSNGKEVGRAISGYLAKNLNHFNISATSRPGAPLMELVKKARTRVKEMNDDDWMVLLGGANGLSECECGTNECMDDIKELGLELTNNNKKFLIVETPYRYHDNTNNINNRIRHQNLKLKETSDLLGCPYIKINEILSRDHYTRHGLHLNHKGKDKVAALIVNSIKFSPKTPNNFLAQVNQVIEQER